MKTELAAKISSELVFRSASEGALRRKREA
jgi:hypothetical protein